MQMRYMLCYVIQVSLKCIEIRKQEEQQEATYLYYYYYIK